MVSFRNLQSTTDVLEYTAHLNTLWPERLDIIRHICRQVEALPFPTPRVLELCSGPGQLAKTLLETLPTITYSGIDFSEPLLRFTEEQLALFGDRATLIRADLNKNDWLTQVSQPVHAIVSMQSLHDLGDEAAVNRIYGLAKSLLVPGGLFLNADLIVPPQQDKPGNPGRRSISRHLELLQTQGYKQVACTLAHGEFGCFVGFAPHF